MRADSRPSLSSSAELRGAYARRHEDQYAVGLLDLAIKFPNHPHLLAEGKIVQHQSFAPTPRQFEEGKEYIAAGGLCALIGWDPMTKAMYVHEWVEEASKKTAFTERGNYALVLESWLVWRGSNSGQSRQCGAIWRICCKVLGTEKFTISVTEFEKG